MLIIIKPSNRAPLKDLPITFVLIFLALSTELGISGGHFSGKINQLPGLCCCPSVSRGGTTQGGFHCFHKTMRISQGKSLLQVAEKGEERGALPKSMFQSYCKCLMLG